MIRKANAHDAALPWESSATFVAARARRLPSAVAGVETVYIEVEPGGRILPHAQKHTETLFCIEGRGTFTLNNEETPLRGGDQVTIRPKQVQGLNNDSDHPLRLLLIRALAPPTRLARLRALFR